MGLNFFSLTQRSVFFQKEYDNENFLGCVSKVGLRLVIPFFLYPTNEIERILNEGVKNSCEKGGERVKSNV